MALVVYCWLAAPRSDRASSRYVCSSSWPPIISLLSGFSRAQQIGLACAVSPTAMGVHSCVLRDAWPGIGGPRGALWPPEEAWD